MNKYLGILWLLVTLLSPGLVIWLFGGDLTQRGWALGSAVVIGVLWTIALLLKALEK